MPLQIGYTPHFELNWTEPELMNPKTRKSCGGRGEPLLKNFDDETPKKVWVQTCFFLAYFRILLVFLVKVWYNIAFDFDIKIYINRKEISYWVKKSKN